jgi:hypothetical protein
MLCYRNHINSSKGILLVYSCYQPSLSIQTHHIWKDFPKTREFFGLGPSSPSQCCHAATPCHSARNSSSTFFIYFLLAKQTLCSWGSLKINSDVETDGCRWILSFCPITIDLLRIVNHTDNNIHPIVRVGVVVSMPSFPVSPSGSSRFRLVRFRLVRFRLVPQRHGLVNVLENHGILSY